MGVSGMYYESSNLDILEFIGEMMPIFFCVMIIIMIALFAVYFFLKKQDDKKELMTRKVKILEKPIHQGNIEWYVVECENGERLKLRSFQANDIIIAVGDKGIISYKGRTIQSFQRKS